MKLRKHLGDALKRYLVSYTQMQLIITVVAVPILIGWGLGYSVMSLVGNLIFTPFLVIFLMLSSLMLFAHLLGIPHDFLTMFVNKVTMLWSWLLQQGSPSWLIECAQPPWCVLIAIPVSAYVMLRHKFFSTYGKRVSVLCFLIVCCYGICYMQRCCNYRGPQTCCLDEKLYITCNDDHTLTIIDAGYFARKKSIEKAIAYEVRPWITKKYGAVHIKELRMKTVTIGGLKAAHHLSTIWPIDSIWVPYFTKKISKATWHAFFTLRETALAKHIKWLRYAHKSTNACLNGRPSKTH
jgi:hypothetical protein